MGDVETLRAVIKELGGSVSIMLFLGALGALAMKAVAVSIIEFLSMKMSQFGIGCKLKIDGEVYYLTDIGFLTVKFRKSMSKNIMFIPISVFLTMKKEILFSNEHESSTDPI